MVIEIRKFEFSERVLKTNLMNKKSVNLDLISQRNHRMNMREISEN